MKNYIVKRFSNHEIRDAIQSMNCSVEDKANLEDRIINGKQYKDIFGESCIREQAFELNMLIERLEQYMRRGEQE